MEMGSKPPDSEVSMGWGRTDSDLGMLRRDVL